MSAEQPDPADGNESAVPHRIGPRITDTLHEADDAKRRIQALTEEDYLRHERELQRWIEERCREAEEHWKAAHPSLAPGWCVTVPVRILCLPDPRVL